MRYIAWSVVFGLALIGCGSSTAESLLEPSSVQADSGTQDVAPDITADQAAEATDHPDVSDDVIVDVALEVASDIAPEVVDEPVETVPDPMVSPDVPVTEWKGKLSPGSMVSKEMVGFRPTADPPSGELYPLVVFARDHQAQKDSYKKTMKHIAQFGYVTASVDYDLGLLDPDHHAPVENLKRAIDVLTTKPPDNVGNVVDPKRIAAMGHAVGGKAAVWLALVRPSPPSKWVSSRFPRYFWELPSVLRAIPVPLPPPTRVGFSSPYLTRRPPGSACSKHSVICNSSTITIVSSCAVRVLVGPKQSMKSDNSCFEVFPWHFYNYNSAMRQVI